MANLWNIIKSDTALHLPQALTIVLFWRLFPSLLRNLGNKHHNNPLVSAETVRHSSACIILYVDDDTPRVVLWNSSLDTNTQSYFSDDTLWR